MQVLVVDDSKAMRSIVARALKGIRVVENVLEAESAEAAINEVLPNEPVDLILCDWNMGGMSGLEFLEALRAASWTVPFGFITSEAGETTRKCALEAGAAFLVTKPFARDDLEDLITGLLVTGTVVPGRPAEPVVDQKHAIAEVLEALFGRPTSVTHAIEPPPRHVARFLARYVTPSGDEVALCVVETRLATLMAAALAKLAPAAVAAWTNVGTLSDDLAENLHEVANVLAKMVSTDERRCVLDEIAAFAPGEQLPGSERIETADSREDFYVTIDGYGEGLLSLIVL